MTTRSQRQRKRHNRGPVLSNTQNVKDVCYVEDFYAPSESPHKTMWRNSVPCKPKKYRMPLKSFILASKKIQDYLVVFCDNISIPGFKYLTERHLPWYHRALWLLGIAAWAVACAMLIHKTWWSWRTALVIVAMAERPRAVWDVPFPAVTLCPRLRIDQKRLNYTDAMVRYNAKNLTEDEADIVIDLALPCEVDESFGKRFHNLSAIEHIESFSVRLPHAVQRVFYRKRKLSLQNFRPLMTESGLCHVFNMIPAKSLFRNNTFHGSREYLKYGKKLDWDVGAGYSSTSKVESFPYRSLGAGKKEGLTVLFGTVSDYLENFCSEGVQGYEVTIQSPAYLPSVSEQSFVVPLNAIVDVAVKPQEVLTSDDLRAHYSPAQRQCYFPEERPLRFFRQYTQHNCHVECLANVTLERCGCVAFHMPRDLEANICGNKMMPCMEEARLLFQLSESGLSDDSLKDNQTDFIRHLTNPCGCQQSCNSLVYHIELTQAEMDMNKYINSILKMHMKQGDKLKRILNISHWSLLNIYFKEPHFIPTKRIEIYGIMTFLANCGGILGLCLGMSALSVLELLYWMLLRPLACPRAVAPLPRATPAP